jgi:hypothetical protein
MSWTLRLIVLRLMTWEAVRILQLIVATHMTLHALCRRMSARQREVRRVVIELCTIPTVCTVALSTIMTEVALNVVRVSCSGEVCLVAIPTRTGKILIHVIPVAVITPAADMTARKWEPRRTVIEYRRLPHCCVMARRAVDRKAWRHMPRILWLIPLREMTLLTVVVEH